MGSGNNRDKPGGGGVDEGGGARITGRSQVVEVLMGSMTTGRSQVVEVLMGAEDNREKPSGGGADGGQGQQGKARWWRC